MVEIRHIRYFLAVAEEGNFTRAAERCGIQQPPLSKQISDLERWIGAPLFQRIPRGAVLTEAGKAFRAAVQHIPDQITHAVTQARQAARGELGVLRLGYPGGAAFNRHVTDAIRSFVATHPGVEISVEEANTPELRQGLLKGVHDLAFLRSDGEDLPELTLWPITDEALVTVLPAAHPLAAAPDIALEQLKDESFILLPPRSGPILHQAILTACSGAGFQPRLSQTAVQIGSVINLVEAGLGISLVPDSLSCIQRPGVVFRQIRDGAPRVGLSLAHRRGDNRPLLRNFLRQIRG